MYAHLKNTLAILCLGTVAWTSPGCGLEEAPDADASDPAAEALVCESSEDCGQGEVCTDGACQARTTCEDNDDCADDEICGVGQGICMPDCNVSGCADPMKECNVASGICQPTTVGAACADDDDCDTDWVCSPMMFVCIETFGPCASDADCDDGYFCPSAIGLCVVDSRSQGG